MCCQDPHVTVSHARRPGWPVFTLLRVVVTVSYFWTDGTVVRLPVAVVLVV